MTGEAHIAYTMGGLLVLGGGIGYVRARSVPSLVAGCCFGTGYVISGMLIANGSEKQGHGVGAGLSTLLAGAMLPRGLKAKKPMPIAVGALGVITAVYSGSKLQEWW